MTAPIIMSPGIYLVEDDRSQYINTVTNTIPGFVVLAPKGVVNEATLVTSLSQLTQLFGIPTESYPGLLAAREFLTAGGAYCWIVRVTDGSDTAATAVVPDINGSDNTTFTGLTTGSGFNNDGVAISYSTQVSESVSASETLTTGSGDNFSQTLANVPVVPGTVVVSFGDTQAAIDDSNGNLVFPASGDYTSTNYSGTVDYNTGVVAVTSTGLSYPVDLGTVTVTANYFSAFTLQVLQYVYNSDDTLIATYVVETYTGLTAANGVAAINGVSQYVTVDSFNSSFPTAGVYPLSGGTDGADDIIDADYIGNTIASPTGLQCFAYPDQLAINLVLVPGASQSSAVRQALIELASTTRGDSLCLIDPPEDLTPQAVVEWANATGSYSAYGVIDSNYAAIYYPYYSTNNNVTGDVDITPPCAAAIQAFARSTYWEAPAGPNRGLIQNDAGLATLLNPGDRAYLGTNRINPLANLNGMGDMVLGQYTATLEASSLDRVGARMTLLFLEKALATSLYAFLFEPNTAQTWNQVELEIQPFLTSQVNLGRLYAAQIYCDSVTNIPQNVENNIMVAVVVLELLDYAEIIVCNFQLESYGTTITESLVSPTAIA